jgi:choline-glycine betaine transporter
LPLCFRTTLAPLFGKAIWGWLGDLIDIVTIITIVAGLCTSLGLGASQIVAGMQRLEWLDSDLDADGISKCACFVTGVITLLATISVVCGMDRGIKTCSQVAFVLGNFLLGTVFFLDAPWYILNVMVQSFGYHAQNFRQISFYTDAFAQLGRGEGSPVDGKGANAAWMDWWTIFYWGWWISWAPFVGTFMARISKGRTIRQVVGYTLTVPFFYALVWFCTFGSAGIRMDRKAKLLEAEGLRLFNNSDYYLNAISDYRPSAAGKCFDVPALINHTDYSSESAAFTYTTNARLTPVCKFAGGDGQGYWFDLMNQYHGMGKFLSVVSLITTALYFVTSSDSGSLVVDLIAANGKEAHVVQRVFWALTEGAVAISLLWAGGSDSLKALQALSICAGLPFTILLMYICTSLWRALKIDQGHMPQREERTDWSLPLYGGVFDIFETLLSCGKAPVPAVMHVKNFALGLACPPFLLWKSLRSLSEKTKAATDGGAVLQEKPSSQLENVLMTMGASLCYIAFVIFHILTGTKEDDLTGMFAFGWVALVGFATIVAVVRRNQRIFYNIEGNGAEDFFAVLFFWPQVLAQMVHQTEFDRVERKALTPKSPLLLSSKAEV